MTIDIHGKYDVHSYGLGCTLLYTATQKFFLTPLYTFASAWILDILKHTNEFNYLKLKKKKISALSQTKEVDKERQILINARNSMEVSHLWFVFLFLCQLGNHKDVFFIIIFWSVHQWSGWGSRWKVYALNNRTLGRRGVTRPPSPCLPDLEHIHSTMSGHVRYVRREIWLWVNSCWDSDEGVHSCNYSNMYYMMISIIHNTHSMSIDREAWLQSDRSLGRLPGTGNNWTGILSSIVSTCSLRIKLTYYDSSNTVYGSSEPLRSLAGIHTT